jgi:hypothetical protein
MKIAFLCAAAEPGRDGVGDYTRRLAAACADFGHACRVLALNDRHLGGLATEWDPATGGVTRWPAAAPWTERAAAVRAALARFAPDWISWQMVSYGYDPKGVLGPGLVGLARALRGWRTHVMLHEVWIGVARGDSCWARLTGWRQRRGLLAFLRAAAPIRLETSNPSYAALLARHGRGAAVAPVFSNIPVAAAPPERRAAALDRHLPPARRAGGRLVCVTFGTLHPQWRPAATARGLRALAERHGREPMLLALGRTGAHGPRLLAELARHGVTTVATGELPPAEVSCLLQAADLGVTAHPRALLGKSGAVAAMLDHGLPVLAPRDDWRLRAGPAAAGRGDPRLARLADLAGDGADAWLRRRRAPGDTFPARVARFLASLSA